MSSIKFNGRVRKAAMHTEVSRPGATIWISGFREWMKFSDEHCAEKVSKAISHETLHLILRRKIGIVASKTLDQVLHNDFESIDYHGLCDIISL